MVFSRCFVCENADEKVTQFTNESFQTCSDMVAFRKVKNHKYGDLQLMPDALTTHGYHKECYKRVVTVKEKSREDFKTFKRQRKRVSKKINITVVNVRL